MNSNTDRVGAIRTQISFISGNHKQRCRGLYLLDLLSLFPYRHPDEIRNQTVFCATVFVASSGLRPVCRPLSGRSLPWISLEIRAFGWAAAYAAVAAFVAELVELHSVRLIWPNFLDSWLRSQFCFSFGALCISVLSSGSRRRTRESSWPVTGKD
jgi:hypothetical protein